MLRESSRQAGKGKSRPLANLTHWPPAQREALRRVLRGEPLVAPDDAFEMVRSLPHGHVAAALGRLRRLGVDQRLAPKQSRPRELVTAMSVARILAPQSTLAPARSLGHDPALTSLGQTLAVDSADAPARSAALDGLLPRQPQSEAALAARQLAAGTLAL